LKEASGTYVYLPGEGNGKKGKGKKKGKLLLIWPQGKELITQHYFDLPTGWRRRRVGVASAKRGREGR